MTPLTLEPASTIVDAALAAGRAADGTVIGAVGISGDASDKDEYCAITGVREAGLRPDPEEPSPDWAAAGL